MQSIKGAAGLEGSPVDCFILSLYHLQIFYCNEIRRGIAGLGEYTIASELVLF